MLDLGRRAKAVIGPTKDNELVTCERGVKWSMTYEHRQK